MTAPVTAPTTATTSDVLANLDSTPVVRASPGRGLGRLLTLQATITPTASQAVSVLNRMIRIPSNSIVRRVAVLLDAAATTLNADVGLWYSDSTTDGTSLVNAGNLTAISSAFFAYELKLGSFYPAGSGANPQLFSKPTDGTTIAASFGPVDITFANANGAMTDGQYLPSQSYLPIWQAVANNLALQTTPVGAFTNSAQAAHFNTASAGGSVYVRSDDPGGFFDICMQLTTTGSAANVKVTMFADIISNVG